MLHFRNWVRILTTLILISTVTAILPSYASAASRVTYSHRLAQNSLHTTCLQPPKHVDLMKLSDAQLQAYGLPTHSMIEAQPKTWERLFSHAPHRTCGSSPDIKHSIPKLTIPRAIHCGGTPGDMCPNSTWAGNQDVGSRGTYREAEAEFTVPGIPTSPSNAYVLVWAGVGGSDFVTKNSVLVQAGIFATPNGNSIYYESFYEVDPGTGAAVNLPLCSLHANNLIYVYVASNPNNDGQDYFYIQNETANCYNDASSTNTSYFSDSATGECIVEREDNGGIYFPLANFGTLTFGESDGCEVYDNSTQVLNGIGNFPHNYYQIYNDPSNPNQNTIMASVGGIYNNGYDYSVKWVRGS
jgi:hypothetical protein